MIIHAVSALVQKRNARFCQVLPKFLHLRNAVGHHQIVRFAVCRFMLLQRLGQFVMQRQCLFLPILVHGSMNTQQSAGLAKHQI
ncbi:MAG TPA: hypothetical protein VIK35_02335 [Verrucomicrobiae bacterium]